MPTALITGITGQDGSYLAELLLEKGYKVIGATRRTSTPIYWRIEHILDQLELVSIDLHDVGSIIRAIQEYQPDEIYNLGAQSHVRVSFD
ncbi:MAG: GDP-mannose 4,6-dehydratase, partial [Candidatus Heimdallarchaeota archaeon]|nr:GDP-mannose 4,6-dehydratase [Candidatus Heimdallarchaeota archaeon]